MSDINSFLKLESLDEETFSLEDRDNPVYYISLNIPNPGRFLKMRVGDLEKVKEVFRHKAFTKVCDALLIDIENRFVILVELKKTLRLKEFLRAVLQLMSTYMKFMMILHLFEDSTDYAITLLIASESIRPVNEKTEPLEFSDRRRRSFLDSPDYCDTYGLFQQLQEEGRIDFDSFPFYTQDFKRLDREIENFRINEIFRRREVTLYFKRVENGSSISISQILEGV